MISWEIPMKFEIFFTWYRLIEEYKLVLKTENDYECQWIMMFMIYVYCIYNVLWCLWYI